MEFKVFTLNCWGIPYVSKDKAERIQAIASVISKSKYDVVCLQEVWVDADYFIIKDTVKGVLAYSHYFYSGVLGSGVCIFSKHPIINTHFHKWMINGYVHKIHHGDWFGGKGVGLCQIKFKDIIINVYSAHLHAEYNKKQDEYFACRIVQAYETAQFIQVTSNSADVVILAGDLNCEPGDLAYRLITGVASLRDSVIEKRIVPKLSTNLDLKNSYTPASYKLKEIAGPRIDYILYRGCSNVAVILEDYFLPLPECIPDSEISYSDHEAITSSLRFRRGEVDLSNINVSAHKSILMDGIDVLNNGIENLARHKIYYWIFTMMLFMIIIVSFLFVPPFNMLLHILRIVLTVVMCYTFIMATLWNMIEWNSLNASKLAMEVALNGIDLKNS